MNTKQLISPNSVGRPSVVTPDVVAKLVSVLQRGVSITRACIYARIDRASFYRKYNEDEEFRNRIDDARNFATVVAAEVVVDDIVKNRNVQTAKWYLERKDPEEFGIKPQVQINNQKNENYFISVKDIKELYETEWGKSLSAEKMLAALNGNNNESLSKATD